MRWQRIWEHVISSTKGQGLICQVYAEDSLACFRGGDSQGRCLVTPDPTGWMAVVTPPMYHPFFDLFVVGPLGVTSPTVNACPPVRLPAVVFEHNRAIRLGVRNAPIGGHVIIRAHVVIIPFSRVRVQLVNLSCLCKECLFGGEATPIDCKEGG